MQEVDINWKAFALLIIIAQVIAPAQFNYYFNMVPDAVHDFTFMDSVWNFIYVEAMLVMFAFAGTGMVYFYEYINLRYNPKEYKPDTI
jgi:hypothetical protein